jgi:hypothetical protein
MLYDINDLQGPISAFDLMTAMQASTKICVEHMPRLNAYRAIVAAMKEGAANHSPAPSAGLRP